MLTSACAVLLYDVRLVINIFEALEYVFGIDA